MLLKLAELIKELVYCKRVPFLPNVHCIGADCSVLWYVNEAPCTKLRRKEESKGYKEDKNGVVYVTTYILEVLWDQLIKLIQLVSDSELRQC